MHEQSPLLFYRNEGISRLEDIADMLEPILLSADEPIMNMKLIEKVSSKLGANFEALKEIMLKVVEWDNYLCVPTISVSLEHIKHVGGGRLATQFMETEMDFWVRMHTTVQAGRPR